MQTLLPEMIWCLAIVAMKVIACYWFLYVYTFDKQLGGKGKILDIAF